MVAKTLLLLTLSAAAVYAAPAHADTDTDTRTVGSEHQKRQDYSALLKLASSAGISIPTSDPALLLSLGPVAGRLLQALPTAPVLSALENAAPSGFLSKVVHDPHYAASFESQFAAGSSPSWFLALPSSVKAYLHTYSNYGGIATELGNAESILATAESGVSTGYRSASPSTSASAASSAMIGTSTPTFTTLGTTAPTASPNDTGSQIKSGTTSSQTIVAPSPGSVTTPSAIEATTTTAMDTSESGGPATTLPVSASTGAAPSEGSPVIVDAFAVAGIFALVMAL
ncbi:MAG: hypothetical protein MMC23_004986 [Stictis urceolatum]|nr:hypothetical protein [Stictis urceolata]